MDDLSVSSLLAYCGLNCSTCRIYAATGENDPLRQKAIREEVALTIFERYGKRINAADVTDCDGCKTGTGRLFSGCRECEIRQCAIEKGKGLCAFCEDYPCEKLHKFVLTEAVDRDPGEA